MRTHAVRYDRLPLLRFHPGGVQQELDAWFSRVKSKNKKLFEKSY